MSQQSTDFKTSLKALDEIATHPTVLTMFEASNIDSTDAFVQVFDASAAGDVTLGTTAPKASFFVPAGDGTKRGAREILFPSPMQFSIGIVAAATTTADGNTAVTTALDCNFVRN